jgi:hypothetical protein
MAGALYRYIYLRDAETEEEEVLELAKYVLREMDSLTHINTPAVREGKAYTHTHTHTHRHSQKMRIHTHIYTHTYHIPPQQTHPSTYTHTPTHPHTHPHTHRPLQMGPPPGMAAGRKNNSLEKEEGREKA